MTSRLTKNIFSAAGQTIVQTAILLLLYRYLLDHLGIERLGIWSIVLATASAARVSELGLGGSITKFVATFCAQRNEEAASEALQTAVISVGALFGVFILIAYPLLLWALPHLLPTAGLEEGRAILPYGLISLWLTSVASIWMGGLDACLRSELRAALMISGSIVFFLLSVAGVSYFGLLGLAAAQVVQGMFLVISGWMALRRIMHYLPVLPARWKLSSFREMLGYGINFQINSVVMLLFEPTTKILLGRYGGLSAAGYFEMAQRLVMKIRALVVESNRVIVPVYAGMNSHESDAINLYVQNMRHLLFLVVPMFAALIALIPAISEVWVGNFEIQFVIMGVCITLAWFLNTISTPAYFAYLGQGKLRWVTVAHLVMGVTNILTGLFIGRLFGWQGVIGAFVVSLVIGSLIPVLTYHYENQIKFYQVISIQDVKLICICFGAAVISLVAYWSAIEMTLINKWLRAAIVTVGTTIVSLSAIWLHPLSMRFFIEAKSILFRGRRRS